MKGKKWTEEMIQKLREGYADRLNRDIAKDLGVSVRSVEWWAGRLGLRKRPGFLTDHRKEIYGGRVCRANPGWLKKGHDVGRDHWYKDGHQEAADVRERRLAASAKARRRQTYDELVRIKYGLRRRTRLRLPDRVYWIDKSKYIKEDDER